ncbi:hypothetical protein GCM10022226_05950 [Sphaerisporangium flaviroseum]|uniref:MFS transporter n=1 Tax=Sphaerisporangium flaviroseum TaxID=509199 RepID=A0ABP7HIN0_9ACTN
MIALPRCAPAEFVGTAPLVTVVVGSGIMAQTLSPHDVGLHLPQNSIATVVGLGVLIVILGPVPAVTVGRAFSDTFAGIAPASVPGFVVAQPAGGAIGLVLVHGLFGLTARSADQLTEAAEHL